MQDGAIQAGAIQEKPQAAIKAHQSFFSPVIDFLMVGGLTFLLFPLSFLPPIAMLGREGLVFYALIVAIFINYPHFMHSYQLLYVGLPRKLFDPASARMTRFRYWVAGVLSPIGILALLGIGAMQDSPVFLGYVVNLMFFLVGWHYVKQGYGVLMALSVRKKVFFAARDKHMLLANAYIVWLTAWISSNSLISDAYAESVASVFKGIPYQPLDLPHGIAQFFLLLMAISLTVTIRILLKTRKTAGTLPYNGITGYFCALYFWIIMGSLNPFVLMFVPALHSLQYLLFVWKMTYEKSRQTRFIDAGPAQNPGALRYMGWFFAIGIIGGALGFELLPLLLGEFIAVNPASHGPQFMVFMFFIFINIHHYFIDFAIWRRENADMKYLFH